MENNTLFHNRYHLERLLGRGNFSEVWLAKDTKSNINVALKIYAPATGLDDHGIDIFAREFALVASVNHKNLMGPMHYDSWDRKPYLVLPYCKNGSIVKQVGKFSEEQTWLLLRDVASGLAWLHSLTPPVIHQDIKPDNIMLGENGNYVLTDFGVSTHLRSTLRKSMSQAFSSAGTTAYMAPERFSKKNTPIMANDIYSLGATAYEMLTGRVPFGEDGGLLQNKGAEIPEIDAACSDNLKKAITLCLQVNPWDRPTAEQLVKYAETAIQGKQVHFAGEKSLLQRKWPYLAVVSFLIIIGAVIVTSISQRNQRHALQEEEICKQQELNVQIVERIESLVGTADSLIFLGDAHEAYYENYYIEAYNMLNEAEEQYLTLPDTVLLGVNLRDKLSIIKQKLNDALVELQKKADFFDDDIDIASSFETRINQINSVLSSEKDTTSNIILNNDTLN